MATARQRRSFPRFSVSLKGQFSFSEVQGLTIGTSTPKQNVWPIELSDISQRGIGATSVAPEALKADLAALPVGSQVRFDLSLPTGKVRLPARLVWVTQDDGCLRMGVFLALEIADATTRRAYHAWVFNTRP